MQYINLLDKRQLADALGLDYAKVIALIRNKIITPKIKLSQKTMYFSLDSVKKEIGLS